MPKYLKVSHRYFYILSALIVCAVAIVVLEATNTTHFFHKTAVVRSPAKPIESLPTQPATNNANKTLSSSNTISQGTATDENGKVPAGVSSNPSSWSTSNSGAITLKLPLNNTTLQSGDTITGSASVSQVQYRLIDNSVGVIAQGPINVVGGNFTASVNFTPHSSGGQLDIFSTEPGGQEINEVQIEVNF